LLAGTSNVAYAAGHLLYMRENSLMAHPFDPDAFELKGDPFPISESVQFNARFSIATFSVSRTGILVYEGSSAFAAPELALVDLKGKVIVSFGQPEIFVSARLSKDARKIAMDLYDVRVRNSDVCVYEIGRGVNTRFTFDPAVEWYPVWSPDGSEIVFSSGRKGHQDLYEKISTGAANEELLLESSYDKTATDWSPDGKFIVFTSQGRDFSICYVPTSGPGRGQAVVVAPGEDPVWAPNSRAVIFSRNVNNRHVLSLLDVPSKQYKDIARISGSAAQPSWAR
jgi:eukaryotic-like serine/threonine-protein kinase